jgi:hypothetical protein
VQPLGIVPDASHASDDALRDLLELSRGPVVLSHSGCWAVCDHPRNIDDELLRALAARGGVIQINALPIAMVNDPGNGRTAAISEILLRYRDAVVSDEVSAAEDRDYAVACRAHPNPVVNLDDYIAHVEHAVAVAGIDHVGIGCDLDGGGGHFPGLRDIADFPNLTRALLARGWTEPALAKLGRQHAARCCGRRSGWLRRGLEERGDLRVQRVGLHLRFWQRQARFDAGPRVPHCAQPGELHDALALGDERRNFLSAWSGHRHGASVSVSVERVGAEALEDRAGHDPVTGLIGVDAVLAERESGVRLSVLLGRLLERGVNIDHLPAALALRRAARLSQRSSTAA